MISIDQCGQNTISVIPGANGRLAPDDVARNADLIRRADALLVQFALPQETTLAPIA